MRELMLNAVEARNNAYAPYSEFKVGAALMTKSGKIYKGCNIENGAYGDTVCAERTAFFKAISEGERKFEAIAIVGGKGELCDCFPCGACRQVMAEFCDGDFKIVIGTPEKYRTFTLSELLPHCFGIGGEQ